MTNIKNLQFCFWQATL